MYCYRSKKYTKTKNWCQKTGVLLQQISANVEMTLEWGDGEDGVT
jgi:hypothetical protein